MEILSGFTLKSVLAVLVIYIAWKIQKFLRKYQQWKKATSQVSVVGPLHPIWGSLHKFQDVTGLFHILKKIVVTERPSVICYWHMFLFPSFNVCHPDSVKVLLKSSEPKPISTGGAYSFLMEWIGEGLLTSSGKRWERNRRLLTPAFHFDILRPYVNIYNSSTDLFLNNLKPFAGNDKSVDIFPLVTLETLDTILKCAFSYEGNIQTEGEKHPYVAAVGRLGVVVSDRWTKPWLYWDLIFNRTQLGQEHNDLCRYVHEFSENVIKERRQSLAKDGPSTKRHLDFLDILLTAKDDDGVGLTDPDIRAEVDTFLFEGHDTTASAISWAIYHLAKYPQEQEIVHRELSEVVGEKDYLAWENLQKLPKLTAFIKESMRMISPVPGISRVLTSPMKFGDVIVPAGTDVDLAIYSLHHHPDFWPEHDVFKPERFLQEDIGDRHPYSFIPFSAGSRNCIGQHFVMDEIKVVLGRLIQRYRISLVPGHSYEISASLVMRAKNGIPITLENR